MADLERPNAGEVLTASLLDSWVDEIERIAQGVFGNITATAKPLVKVELTSSQSIADAGTGDVVTWDAEVIDERDMWDPAQPDLLGIPTGLAGFWLFVQALWFNDTSGTKASYILRNGTSTSSNAVGGANAPAGTTLIQATSVVEWAAGDQVRGKAFQDSGSSMDLNAGNFGGSYLTGTWLGPSAS